MYRVKNKYRFCTGSYHDCQYLNYRLQINLIQRQAILETQSHVHNTRITAHKHTSIPASVSLLVSCIPGVELVAAVLVAREIQVNVQVL